MAASGDYGEIVIKGPNVMPGYLKNPEATAESIRDGWLHTGDVGYVDEDGYFFIVDRSKDMIIRGGENIYPREIEEVLYAHESSARVRGDRRAPTTSAARRCWRWWLSSQMPSWISKSSPSSPPSTWPNTSSRIASSSSDELPKTPDREDQQGPAARRVRQLGRRAGDRGLGLAGQATTAVRSRRCLPVLDQDRPPLVVTPLAVDLQVARREPLALKPRPACEGA